MPDLLDRLAEIIKAEAKKYPPGYDLDEGCRHVADALLASEEWRAREAVVEAVGTYAGLWRLCHARDNALGLGRAEDLIQLGYVRGEMFAAVARLDAVRGKEPDNADRPA